MPSLMPGTPGAKEVYGISTVREDMSVVIPPEAARRYELGDGDVVVLATTHLGETGFALMNREKALATVLGRRISELEGEDVVTRASGRAYAQTRVVGGKICLTPQMAEAFLVAPGDRLMVVKGARVAMAFTPVELWRERLARRGLHEATERIQGLERF